MTLFEKSLNRSTEFKLWQLKESLARSHNFSTVDPLSSQFSVFKIKVFPPNSIAMYNLSITVFNSKTLYSMNKKQHNKQKLESS